MYILNVSFVFELTLLLAVVLVWFGSLSVATTILKTLDGKTVNSWEPTLPIIKISLRDRKRE